VPERGLEALLDRVRRLPGQVRLHEDRAQLATDLHLDLLLVVRREEGAGAIVQRLVDRDAKAPPADDGLPAAIPDAVQLADVAKAGGIDDDVLVLMQ
jgi:hypothetical protein